jgi:hypothetical protein
MSIQAEIVLPAWVQPIIGDAHCFRETWLLYQMLTRLLLTA